MTKSLEVQNSYVIKKISFTMKGRNVTLLGTLIYLKGWLVESTCNDIHTHTGNEHWSLLSDVRRIFTLLLILDLTIKPANSYQLNDFEIKFTILQFDFKLKKRFSFFMVLGVSWVSFNSGASVPEYLLGLLNQGSKPVTDGHRLTKHFIATLWFAL